MPFKILATNEPLVARGRPVIPYELAKALKLSKVMDKELPRPGSGREYKPSQFVVLPILIFHGGGEKLEGSMEIKAEMSLGEVAEVESLPASCPSIKGLASR